MEALNPYLNLIADMVALFGGMIMLVAVVVTAFRLTRVELAALRKVELAHDRRTLRHHLGYYILLGLEFIVVADILRTIIHPGWEELLVLGTVVLIRTIVSVTLNWELSRVQHIEEEHP